MRTSVLPFITLNLYCIPMEWLSGWNRGKVDLQKGFASQTRTMVWSKLWAHEVLEAWPWRVLSMGCWSLEPALCGRGPDISVILAVCPMNQKEVDTDCWRNAFLQSTRDTFIAPGETNVWLTNHICHVLWYLWDKVPGWVFNINLSGMLE